MARVREDEKAKRVNEKSSASVAARGVPVPVVRTVQRLCSADSAAAVYVVLLRNTQYCTTK
jgi:hypothetical protein